MANKKRTSPITPAQVIEARGGMSQSAAAAVLSYSLRQWQNFESGETAMSVAAFNEFFRAKQAQADTIPHDVIKRIHVDGMTPARAWREHLGLTQEEAANRLGISQSAYAQQEASPRNRKGTREKIAEAFGIGADMLDI